MTELSIHAVKSITTELKRFEANDNHAEFSIKELYITDKNGVKTIISLFADTNQELDIL
jgi:hypothetical protein